MTPYDIVKKAKEMEVMPEAALAMRIRYLREWVGELMEYEGDKGVNMHYILKTMDKVLVLERYLADYKRIQAQKNDTVTDEMIAAARLYPIQLLVEFTKGKARCFNHPDKNPSMYLGNKTNRAICPVCNESWDSIGVLMTRDGVEFREAVRRLWS